MIFNLLSILLALLGLIAAYYFYKKSASSKQQKETLSKLEAINSGQKEQTQIIKELYSKVVHESSTWIQISNPLLSNDIVKAVRVAFVAKNGHIKGCVRAKGFEEIYPFDTSIHNQYPIAIGIKEPAIEFKITYSEPKQSQLSIVVVGYLLDLPIS